MMKKPVLVVMAAGMGSRYGGLKQIDPIDKEGHIIMDFSIYDAVRAGFEKVVFIIKKENEADFKEAVGKRIEKIMDVAYVFQDLNNLPEGYSVPEGRVKPWGTGQAILACKDVVKEPFVIINADDYYGKEVFRKIHTYMVEQMDVNAPVYDICMGGFILANTLSENGGVTRGVCEVGEGEILKRVTETYNIQKTADGMTATDKEGNPVSVQENQHVSMNMWGLTPGFVEELEKGFPEFLAGLKEGDVKSEYLLPTIIDQMIHDGRARVKLLETHDRWFGVTYREDKESVTESIRALIREGVYPEKLF
mgnify:CR=1 FL=1